MRILIDTNILITYLSGRADPYSSESETIMRLCSEGSIEGVVAFHSLSTIWYVTRKAPEELRRGFIKRICLLLTVSGADNQAILQAVDNDGFHDFEDALQDCCADDAGCDYIVTANAKDFLGHSHIPAITPDVLVSMVQSKKTAQK